MLDYLLPYELYPEVVAFVVAAAAAYGRGLRNLAARGRHVPGGCVLAFYGGLLLTYAVMHTHLDYLSQYMFWVHRAQHLVLHHLAALLMVLGRPHEVLAASLTGRAHERAARVLAHPAVRWPYCTVQHPVIAPILFVGLIVLWLEPEIHFAAMLSEPLYRLMNASMLVDGLLFWWLIVDPRGRLDRGLGFGTRILMLWLIMIPQIIVGAWIGLSTHEIFDVYAVCGRAWPISPLTDQQIGGMITWVPAAMMSVVGMLVVFRLWLHESERTAPGAWSGAKS